MTGRYSFILVIFITLCLRGRDGLVRICVIVVVIFDLVEVFYMISLVASTRE